MRLTACFDSQAVFAFQRASVGRKAERWPTEKVIGHNARRSLFVQQDKCFCLLTRQCELRAIGQYAGGNSEAFIAVVVSKLNVMEMAKITSDISQNVNFAIKGNIATNFMEGVGIRFQTGNLQETLDTPTIGEKAQGFTYLVECQN